LNSKGILLFSKIRKKLDIPSTRKFNLQSDKRDGLQGDWAVWKLADEGCFGKSWFKMLPEKQLEVLELLQGAEDNVELKQKLIEQFGLDDSHAEKVTHVNLPDGYASLFRSLRVSRL